MRRLMALAIVVAIAGGVLGAQEPGPRAYLLFVDDLHLDFRQTPRTRAVMQQIIAKLTRDGDLWSVVTTGTSSISLAPTTDVTAVRAAITRVTGNGLMARDMLDPRAAPESRRRADIAHATISDALNGLALRPSRGEIIVLYVTGGYDTRVVAPPSKVIAAATDVRAQLIVVSVRDLVPGADAPSDVRPQDWAAYVGATRASLWTLADQTGGTGVFSKDDLDSVFARLSPR